MSQPAMLASVFTDALLIVPVGGDATPEFLHRACENLFGDQWVLVSMAVADTVLAQAVPTAGYIAPSDYLWVGDELWDEQRVQDAAALISVNEEEWRTHFGRDYLSINSRYASSVLEDIISYADEDRAYWSDDLPVRIFKVVARATRTKVPRLPRAADWDTLHDYAEHYSWDAWDRTEDPLWSLAAEILHGGCTALLTEMRSGNAKIVWLLSELTGVPEGHIIVSL